MNPLPLYIGIMSGTSMDAIDAVLLDMSQSPKIIEHVCIAFPEQLHTDISNLIKTSSTTLSNLGYIDVALADLYADAVNQLLLKSNISASQITAIGCHGQTVHHQPQGKYRFSTQLGSGSTIAEKTSITTITDFRNRDIAAGGEGAPLVPAFHHAFFGDTNENRLIINIGGIANCTWLPTKGNISGYDIGPGNTLMDSWINHCSNKPYDKNGRWAASGKVSKSLLKRLLAEAYFKKSAPKSSGREYFNLNWLKDFNIEAIQPEDVQATLLELTAQTIADTIIKFNSPTTYICGGGVFNLQLMQTIQQLSNSNICNISQLGMQPDQVEAAAFAWLAKCCINGEPGTITSVTGAKHPVILGAIYQA